MTSNEPSTTSVTGDRPIEDPKDDLLGYAPFAKHLADSILAMAPPEGFVIGIYGAWGSGKTTLLRFIEHHLSQQPKKQQPIVVHFNPWWFSGQEDLTRHFFGQLRSTLSRWSSVSDKVLGSIGNLANTLSDLEHFSQRLSWVRSETKAAVTKEAVSVLSGDRGQRGAHGIK
ncbi:MAG: hypothetical protein RLZZ387_567 [Chloroflexota bacterium]|jgi:predicted KAP-like P-loop ATPase